MGTLLRVGFLLWGVVAGPLVLADPPSRPISTFDSAKQVARDTIYGGHTKDFYCNCDFQPNNTRSGGVIDPAACGYAPRRNAARGRQLEWEHVMPAAFFGRNKSCWKSGHARCVKTDGTPFKGRECCAKVSKAFREAEADLHNLVPAVGELNGDRSDLPYGVVSGEQRSYGRCDFEIGGSPKVAEPREAVRGHAARVWLYMSDTYGVRLSALERQMYEAWSGNDPPDRWELLRDRRIEAAQGNRNPYVR